MVQEQSGAMLCDGRTGSWRQGSQDRPKGSGLVPAVNIYTYEEGQVAGDRAHRIGLKDQAWCLQYIYIHIRKDRQLETGLTGQV